VSRIEIAGMSALTLGPRDAPVELVFLHANGFHSALYAELLAPLADGRRIIAPDLRGHGHTRLPADPQGLKDWRPFVEDILACLAAIEASSVVLAGHSLGGSTGVLAAAQAPDRVRALVLFEPVIAPPPAAGPAPDELSLSEQTRAIAQSALSRRRWFASRAAALSSYRGRGGFRTWPEEALCAYVEEGFIDAAETATGGEGVVLRCDPAWEAAIYLARGDDMWATLAAGRTPLTIRAGCEGTTFPPSSEERLARLRPDADIARIAGTTHYLPQERPDVVRAALAQVLASG
jgi:pimeloyl-ACP methyl ester carboxylesterase